ncbi:MAG TPA: glycosyltransferase family 4 protein, partial [Anoxybacillus sp.]|nr:glycosyltransferase family 4 protein [Anoxybacillus sp.]
SDYVGNVIRQLYPQASPKIRTIYSGVDTERFLPGNHPKMQKIRNEIRKAHGLERKTVILFAGRLSNNKGVDRLIRALPDLSKKFKDLALVIVGSKWFSQNDVTDYVAYVRALAKKLPIPVVTTGFVSPGEIQNWFAAADLFVCTSQWQEPLARVHYEAMAAGLPIVTTARGGNPEVILSGENGLVVEKPEDPSDFAEKITQILSDKSLMKRMGERGRELAVSQYKWDRVASELLEVWDQAIHMTSTTVIEQDSTEKMSIDEVNNTAVKERENVVENKDRTKEEGEKAVRKAQRRSKCIKCKAEREKDKKAECKVCKAKKEKERKAERKAKREKERRAESKPRREKERRAESKSKREKERRERKAKREKTRTAG